MYELVGYKHSVGVGNDGRPYDYYKLYVVGDGDRWTEGREAFAVNVSADRVDGAALMPGALIEIRFNRSGKVDHVEVTM